MFIPRCEGFKPGLILRLWFDDKGEKGDFSFLFFCAPRSTKSVWGDKNHENYVYTIKSVFSEMEAKVYPITSDGGPVLLDIIVFLFHCKMEEQLH